MSPHVNENNKTNARRQGSFCLWPLVRFSQEPVLLVSFFEDIPPILLIYPSVILIQNYLMSWTQDHKKL